MHVSPRLGRRLAGAFGLAAVLIAIPAGAAGLLRKPQQAAPPTQAATFPIGAVQLTALLRQPPDYGPLRDPGRRASCLTGLGYPAGTGVLTASGLDVAGTPGVLLVLSDTPETLVAVVVATNCSAADTGLLAETTLARPSG